MFASGDPATTGEAINDAKRQLDGTRYIADIAIDDETSWKFGYAVQCIIVSATAFD